MSVRPPLAGDDVARTEAIRARIISAMESASITRSNLASISGVSSGVTVISFVPFASRRYVQPENRTPSRGEAMSLPFE
jgi:hypothetical protein